MLSMNSIAYMSKIERRQSAPTGIAVVQMPTLLGESAAMQALKHTLQRAARSTMTVLINGETGTGKELAARALHCQSPRAGKPFIALNMAAIPRDLLESELFGHERGAFTGAIARRAGRFEQADGGTLFLDEIGDMPLELQTRLLRVLSDGVFYPVGARSPVQVDVRVVTATHQNLEQQVAEGRFREDLFHRLNVIRVVIPPLRERREDVHQLLDHYLHKAAEALNEQPKTLAFEVLDYLFAFHWPGNIRQLENVCHWLTLMANTPEICLSDLPDELTLLDTKTEWAQWHEALLNWAQLQLKAGKNDVAKDAQATFESVLISIAMEQCDGHRYQAAKRLGYGRNTLTRKIKELQLEF
jgi:two-component system nitrogen regulation response regulator GlnG